MRAINALACSSPSSMSMLCSCRHPRDHFPRSLLLPVDDAHRAHLSTTSRSRQLGSGTTTTVDHHEMLGVPRNASQSEIKQAYYTKSKALHPDAPRRSVDDDDQRRSQAFIDVKSAYDALRMAPGDRRDQRDDDEETIFRRQQQFYRRTGRTVHDAYARSNQRGYRTGPFQPEWRNLWIFFGFGLCLATTYNIMIRLLWIREERYWSTLNDREEIARSFLRQSPYKDRQWTQFEFDELTRLLKTDIDEAHRRRLEEFRPANHLEIREESRWFAAARNTTPRTAATNAASVKQEAR